MKISIITVVYNRANTIKRAIDSVKNQNYPYIEHIILDGCSTDETVEIIKSNIDNKTKFISEPDFGMYDAINKGMRLATGEVIGLLHSDDIFPNNQILSDVMKMFSDTSLDAVYGDAEFFSSKSINKIIRKYSSANFEPSKLAWGIMPAHTTLFLRRKVYEKIGKYNISYSIASDFDYICRAFLKYQIKSIYIQKTLTKMQTGGKSSASLINTWTINKEVMRACRENNIQTNWLKLLSKYPKKILEYF